MANSWIKLDFFFWSSSRRTRKERRKGEKFTGAQGTSTGKEENYDYSKKVAASQGATPKSPAAAQQVRDRTSFKNNVDRKGCVVSQISTPKNAILAARKLVALLVNFTLFVVVVPVIVVTCGLTAPQRYAQQ